MKRTAIILSFVALLALAAPTVADLIVSYTLQTATISNVVEVSITRSQGVVVVKAQYFIEDEAGTERIRDSVDVVLAGQDLADLVAILSGPVLSAVNAKEGL